MKKGFTFGLASLLGAVALVGCAKAEEAPTIAKLKMSGINVAYKEGSEIDWSKLSIAVTYSDSTTKTFTHFEYDVDSVSETGTEAVLYTQGLHAQSALAEGNYHITFAEASNLSTKIDLATITVGTATADRFALAGFVEPIIKKGYESNVKNAGTEIESERNDRAVAKEHEKLFIGSDVQYVVGTMNPFVYEPEILFESLDNPSAPFISGEQIYYKRSWEVKKLVGDEYVSATLGDDYSIVDGFVKFNDAAIGNTYSIKFSMDDFQEVEGTGVKAESSFVGFRVEKGLNIYSAKELGILNVTKLTYQKQAELQFSDHGGDTENVFYNGTTHYSPDIDTIWTEYLKNKGVYTEAELDSYADVSKVFLHKNIELTTDDIPSEYLIAKDEFTNSAREGCLRDGVPLFGPIVNDSDVEINGNFWTLDAQRIPLCKCTWSNGFHPYVEESEPIMPGHTPLIKFCGRATNDYDKKQELSVTGQGIIRNINSIGNSGVDFTAGDFEKMLTLTGLIFAKNDYCGATYDNIIAKQYQIGIFANHCVGHEFDDTEKGVKHEQVDRTIVTDTRIYDCANCGLFNFHNGGTLVSKSVFNRFGGAPLMNAAGDKAYIGSNTKFTKDVIFNNEITGEEIYFAALGPDVVAAVNIIKGWNPSFVKLGNNFLYEITDEKGQKYQVMNLVAIGLNGDDYNKATSPEFYSNIYLNYGEANQLNAQVKSETTQWNYFNEFYQSMYDANYAVKYKQTYDARYLTEKETAARNYVAQQMGVDPALVPDGAVAQTMANPDFTAMFDAGFEAAFKEQFDAAFEQQMPKSVYENVEPPVFQTEVKDELFWSNAEGDLHDKLGGEFTTQLEGEYLSILLPITEGADTCFCLVFRISKIEA